MTSDLVDAFRKLPPTDRFKVLVELASPTSYTSLRSQYETKLQSYVARYWKNGNWTQAYGQFADAIEAAFPIAFDFGTTNCPDFKGNKYSHSWLTSRTTQEIQSAVEFWNRAKRDRADKKQPPDIGLWLESLDTVYQYGRTFSCPKVMLTFTRVRKTKDSCPSCKRLEGVRHTAQWWARNRLIPGPGADLDCHGYHCGHDLLTDDGESWHPIGKEE